MHSMSVGKDKLGTGEVEASGSGARRFRVIESDGGAPSFPHWCCAYGQLMLSETTPARFWRQYGIQTLSGLQGDGGFQA